MIVAAVMGAPPESFQKISLATDGHHYCPVINRTIPVGCDFHLASYSPSSSKRRDLSRFSRSPHTHRDTQITKPERFDRMLLILAVAYLLLCGIGPIAKTLLQPSAWCSTNRDIECSIHTIGIIMLEKIRAAPPQALAAVLDLSETVAANWK
jgi:hypothetical protein